MKKKLIYILKLIKAYYYASVYDEYIKFKNKLLKSNLSEEEREKKARKYIVGNFSSSISVITLVFIISNVPLSLYKYYLISILLGGLLSIIYGMLIDKILFNYVFKEWFWINVSKYKCFSQKKNFLIWKYSYTLIYVITVLYILITYIQYIFLG